MREGNNYLGGCCGNLSAAQDILNSVFREGGNIEAETFMQLAQLCIGHDGEFFKKPPSEEGFAAASPVGKLSFIWNLVKPFLKEKIEATHRPVDELDEAIRLVSSGMMYYNLNDFYRRNEPEGSKPAYAAHDLLHLVRVYPAIKTIYEKIRGRIPDTFDGFAVVLKEHPDNLARNGLGQCIYETAEQAQVMLDRMQAMEDQYLEENSRKKGDAALFEIRPIRVTLAEGLTFPG